MWKLHQFLEKIEVWLNLFFKVIDIVTAISRSQSWLVSKHRFKKEQTFKFIHDNEFDWK